MTDPTPPEETTPEGSTPTEEPQPEAQLGLFGSESNAPLTPTRKGRQRQSAIQKAGLDEDRLDSYKALMASLAAKQADEEGFAFSIGAVYREGFGKTAKGLYAHFGLPDGQRQALPVSILRILIVYELAAKRRVDRHIVQGQTQAEINRELANQCRIATQIMRRALYWSERAERLESTSLLAEPPTDYPLNS